MRTIEEIERRLAALPVAPPDPARERRLCDALREAEAAARFAADLSTTPWWRRPIPLWQAAAAIIALIMIDVAWLRPPVHPLTLDAPALAVRVDADVFSRGRSSAEPMDVSRWAAGPLRNR